MWLPPLEAALRWHDRRDARAKRDKWRLTVSNETPSTEFTRDQSEMILDRRPPLPETQERPVSNIKWEAISEDLEKLVKAATEAGDAVSEKGQKQASTRATVITTDKIVIDERARWKCIIPVCFGYGTSPNCPPHSPTAEQMRDIVGRYRYGIFLRYMPAAADHTYPDFLSQTAIHVNDLNEIVGRVETEATYMGYYLAMGFKGGPCCLCGLFGPDMVVDFFVGKEVPRCPVLEGKVCYHYTRARPALEACGVDVFATARNIGWETFLIYPEHPEESVPCVSWHGLVLVA
jgi:predicted metal-binding protein